MHSNNKLINNVAILITSIWLTACGGGGGESSSSAAIPSNTPPANKAPVIGDMEAQSIIEYDHFSFSASASDPDGTITNQSWVQKSGIEIHNTNINENTLSFTAPNIIEDQTVVFTFLATDNDGKESQKDLTIEITALKNISDVEFSDPNLKACIVEASAVHGESADVASFSGDSALNCQEKEIVSLTGIEEFTYLEHLYLGYNNIENLTPLANLLQLKTLDLQGNHITNVNALTNLNHLEFLWLDKNELNDLSGINALTNLQTLRLSQNNITDIRALAPLTRLTNLTLAQNQIASLDGLKMHTKLEYLTLESNPLADISAMPTAKNIKILRLFNTNPDTYREELALSDLTAMSQLTGLTHLVIKGDNINNIDALGSLTQLKELELITYQVPDIHALSNLVLLEKLKLGSYTTPFETIPKMNLLDSTPLSQLTSLKELIVESTKISDFSPIQHLSSLKTLWLEQNENTSFAPMAALTQLETLVFFPTGLTTDDNIDQLSQLDKLTTFRTVWPKSNTNLAILNHMPLLTDLYIGADNDHQLKDFSMLADRPLVSLQIGGTQLSNVEFLSSMSSLKTLALQSTKALNDIAPLNKLTQLERLNLWFNEHLTCHQLDELQSLLTSTTIERPKSCALN